MIQYIRMLQINIDVFLLLLQAKERFLKKCKVTDENLLSGVTIGCVTLKDTQMLEGEALQEVKSYIFIYFYHLSTDKKWQKGKISIYNCDRTVITAIAG